MKKLKKLILILILTGFATPQHAYFMEDQTPTTQDPFLEDFRQTLETIRRQSEQAEVEPTRIKTFLNAFFQLMQILDPHNPNPSSKSKKRKTKDKFKTQNLNPFIGYTSTAPELSLRTNEVSDVSKALVAYLCLCSMHRLLEQNENIRKTYCPQYLSLQTFIQEQIIPAIGRDQNFTNNLLGFLLTQVLKPTQNKEEKVFTENIFTKITLLLLSHGADATKVMDLFLISFTFADRAYEAGYYKLLSVILNHGGRLTPCKFNAASNLALSLPLEIYAVRPVASKITYGIVEEDSNWVWPIWLTVVGALKVLEMRYLHRRVYPKVSSFTLNSFWKNALKLWYRNERTEEIPEFQATT